MKNPLIQPILSIIGDNPQGIREYELLQQLEKTTNVFDELGDDPKLALFRKHFLIMNALYQLQIQLWQEDKVTLSISPLNIVIETAFNMEETSTATELEVSAQAKLAAYYLDWEEYDNTQAEDVEQLLKGFYQKLHHQDNTQAAFKELGLPENSSKTDIKQAYRQQVKDAHPDKGGDTKIFIKLRQAYEHLMSQTV